MTEKPFSSPESPRWENREKSLSEASNLQKDGIKMGEKIAKHIDLPVSGEALYEAIQEIFSTKALIDTQTKGKEKIWDTKDATGKQWEIDWAREKLLDITERRAIWTQLLEIQKKDPNMLLKDFEKMYLKSKNLSLKQIIMDILWLGAQKEAALQKINKLDSYRLPKTAALWSLIASEVMQEYAEDYFEAGRFGIVKKIFALPEKGIDLAKSKAIAVVEKAKPSLKKYFGDMPLAQRDKMFGRMVQFMSEDKIGQRLVAMTETIPWSSVAKWLGSSAKSTLSGVKEWLFSPLCACMMSMMLEWSEDKEKAMIQYVTFLVAGQVIQEGGKWAGKGILPLIEPLLAKMPTDSRTGKLLSVLRKGSVNKALTIGASVALVIIAFQIPMVTDFVWDIAKSIDEGWDHGETREMIIGWVSATSYLMQFTSKRFLPAAVGIEVGKIALDGANPFTEQDEFLFKYVTNDGANLMQTGEQIVGRNPIDAWNARVEKAKGSIIKENELQQKILDYSKLENWEDWVLRTIMPFSVELSQFDLAETQVKEMLQKLTNSPQSNEPIVSKQDIDKLRYREYALAGDDVWNTRDGLGNIDKGSILKPIEGYVGAWDSWNLGARNDKALKWLDDVDGSTEDKLDEFFEHAEERIAEETEKCMISTLVSPAHSPMAWVFVPARYERVRDNAKYAKIEPWIQQVQAAKTQWTTMRSHADNLAKKVVIWRALGVYDRQQWESEGNPLLTPDDIQGKETLAFRGLVKEIQRKGEIIDLTTPKDAHSAFEINEATGWEKRWYGTDHVPFTEARAKIDEEYKKYNSWKNFWLDNRRYNYAALQSMAQTAFKFWVKPQLLEKTLEPITTITRNQQTGNYVTPEIANSVTDNLGKLMLDKVCEDQGKSGVVLTPEKPEISYNVVGDFGKRTFSIEYDQDLGDVIVEQEQIIISHELWQTIRTPVTAKFPRKTPIDKYNPKIRNTLLKPMIQKYLSDKEKERAESDAKTKLTIEKTANKSNNATAFQEYYNLPSVRENGFEKWEKITPESTPPIVYISRCYRMEEMRNAPQKNVWEWRYPAGAQQVKVAVFWGPGDAAEMNLKNLKNFKYAGWNEKTQEVLKTALISGDNVDAALERIIWLTEHHGILETHVNYHDLSTDLLLRLKPYLNNSSDKKAFLKKTLDVLIEHGGIANGEVDDIVKKITQ